MNFQNLVEVVSGGRYAVQVELEAARLLAAQDNDTISEWVELDQDGMLDPAEIAREWDPVFDLPALDVAAISRSSAAADHIEHALVNGYDDEPEAELVRRGVDSYLEEELGWLVVACLPVIAKEQRKLINN